MLLALLVAGGVAAYVVAAAGADQVFQVTARLLGDETGLTGSQYARSSANATDRTSERAEATQANKQAKVQARTARIAVAALEIVVWVATVAAGFMLWRILGRRLRAVRAGPSGGQHILVPLPPGSQQRLVEKRQQIRRILSREAENSASFNTQVRHLMSKRLMIVKPGMPACQVAATMNKQRIRHMLVCQERQLLGIISDRDLKERTGETAGAIMTPEPIVVSPEMAVGPAISIMVSKSISCLPAIDQGEVCGVLTTTDLMLALQCTLQIVGGTASGPYSTGCRAGMPEPAAAGQAAACLPEGPEDSASTPIACQ